MLVKVCGMRQPANISELCKLSLNYIGFIFYPKSPRYAGEILTPEITNEIPSGIKKTGVFVNESLENILKVAKKYNLDTIQLHGSENPSLCNDLKKQGLNVIKALAVSHQGDLSIVNGYQGCCDFILFDTPSVTGGGSGQKFDWSILNRYNGKLPFFLSGGIGPDDAAEILSLKNKYLAGVDINSRFEAAPGLKNIDAIKLFINQLNSPLKPQIL